MAMINLPPLACDCHVHVVGPQSLYPMIEDRQYTAPVASVEDLRRQMSNVDLQRAVIIQPSFYGVDNRCLLDSLKQLDGAGRGVAVLDPSITEEDLRTLSQAGIRGIRINVESSHGHNPEELQHALKFWATKISFLGWHIQLFASQALIQQCAGTIKQLAVQVVLDHFSLLPSDLAVNNTGIADSAEIACIVDLLASGNVWLKLSAPYRLPKIDAGTPSDTSQLAKYLLAANVQRIVWASDWPHTQREKGKTHLQESAYRQISAESLNEQIQRWLPTAALRQTVLVDNPAVLYGFNIGS
jgi:predicted TIM-barrel fold metal-dependent hydrolase